MNNADLAHEIEALKKDVAELKRDHERGVETGENPSAVRGGIQNYLRKSARTAKQGFGKQKGSALLALHLARDGDDQGAEWGDCWTLPSLEKCSPRDVGQFASIVGTEQSAGVLRALCDGDMTVKEIQKTSELSISQIYHSIRGLALLGLIACPEKSRYALTSRGQFAAIMLFAMTASFHNLGIGLTDTAADNTAPTTRKDTA